MRSSPKRRLAVLLALPFLAAGCSAGGDAATTGGAIPAPPTAAGPGGVAAPATTAVDPSVAASADAALSSNTKAICAQAQRARTSFGEIFIADLKLKIDSAGKGAAAVAQADEKITRDVQNYSYALGDMAKLTDDAALKKALTAMSRRVTAFKGDLTKINAEQISALSATLDQACGKG